MSKKETPEVFGDIDIRPYYRSKPVSAALRTLKSAGLTLAIMTAATFISFVFREMGFHEANFILAYMLGVLFVANLTDGYLYGIIASVLGVLVFNYFFTEPYYTLLTYSPEYPVTFITMLIVALITSTYTARAKRESRQVEMREQRMRILYQIGRDLLAVKNVQQVAEIAAKDIARLFGTPVFFATVDTHGELAVKASEGKMDFDTPEEETAYREAFLSGSPCGTGTPLFADRRAYYLPVSAQSGVLGVIGVAMRDEYQLTESQKVFLDTVGAQIALVLERERLYERQQQVKMEMERERLRGDLLRAVSHDLRTPLTGILGSASTMLENYDSLTDDTKKELLQGIYGDTDWLSQLVENTLSMTRFEEGTVKLHKEMEAVEEIVAGAVSRIKKRAGKREILVHIPNELIMIPVDGTLIEQVLVNLLDNAIKHTLEGAQVEIRATIKEGFAVFTVSDDGPGIPPDDIPMIFKRYYTAKDTGVRRPGTGLGLAICRSIVEAHGGDISAGNQRGGGAVFRFRLPVKEL